MRSGRSRRPRRARKRRPCAANRCILAGALAEQPWQHVVACRDRRYLRGLDQAGGRQVFGGHEIGVGAAERLAGGNAASAARSLSRSSRRRPSASPAAPVGVLRKRSNPGAARSFRAGQHRSAGRPGVGVFGVAQQRAHRSIGGDRVETGGGRPRHREPRSKRRRQDGVAKHVVTRQAPGKTVALRTQRGAVSCCCRGWVVGMGGLLMS